MPRQSRPDDQSQSQLWEDRTISGCHLRGEYSSELTPREKEVVLYLCLGMKEAAVARELGIRSATVHSHITRVHRKLNVSSRGLLVAVAIVRGVICAEELSRLLNKTGDCEAALQA